MPRSSSRTKKLSNTSLNSYLTEKDLGCNKNDKDNVGTAGATNEVATLKEAVSAAERNAAAEQAEREKQEARPSSCSDRSRSCFNAPTSAVSVAEVSSAACKPILTYFLATLHISF